MADLPDAKKPEANRMGPALREVEAQLARSRRARDRHAVFALLGLSPAAVLPMLGLAIDFGFEVVLIASVFVSGLESWRAVQSGADAREAEEERRRLLEARQDADD